MNEDYQYGERTTENMSDREFRFGAGKISGYISAFLGVLSLLGVLCFRFPEYLTTPELRDVYNVEVLRWVLKISMWIALAFAGLTFVRNKRKRLGFIGLTSVLLGFALGGYSIPARAVQDSAAFAGVDWMVLDLLKSVILFMVLEKIWPKYPEQAILRPQWRTDLIYFGVNHLLVGLLLLVGNGFAPMFFGWAISEGFQNTVQSWPIWVQVILLIFCADFMQYWSHRIFHEVPFLWKFHAVHHSAEHMDWLAGSRNHLFQVLVDRSLIMIPLYLLGTTKGALDIYVLIAAFQAVFVHTNCGIPFGPFAYVFVTPRFHHWHHSKDDPAIDTNYAVHLPLFDMIFRSFHLPKTHWPKEYGTVSPLPRYFGGQFLYPFRNGEKNESSE